MVSSLFGALKKIDKSSDRNEMRSGIRPENLEEKLFWYYITGTYVLYVIGAQHVLAPLMGWYLTVRIIKKLWNQTKDTPEEEKIKIPFGVWVWVICMLTIYLALIMGLLDYNLESPVRILKSTVNTFARTWALLAVFPLIGSCLKVRPQIIYRAVCILCIQTIVVALLAYPASMAGIPGLLYTSPLMKVGGGKEYYNVGLFIRDAAEVGGIRLYLFAPWAPALGLIGSIYFFITCQESDKRLRWLGMVGAVLMAWGSASRLGTICMIVIPALTWFIANFTRPLVQLATGAVSFFSGVFGVQIITWLKDYKAQLDAQRAGSSQVREMLGRIALYRWWTEAPIWGHAFLEPKGPPLVAKKPIGSHHTWFGILFAHGLVGCLALAVAMIWSFIELSIKSQRSKVAQAALSVLLVLIFYSFGENLEALAYFYWPGLVLLGIAFKEKYPQSLIT